MSARGLTRGAYVPAAVPLCGGACVAVASAVLLSASFLWTVMFFGVCAALIPALVIKDRLLYWLGIFLCRYNRRPDDTDVDVPESDEMVEV